ncbi:type VI secretion system Vgr family protein [Roseomonas xinghualingensis]|uniref:type VI secretion system Vgr family protein n=1 Tax=Roseomonas xinghualingensis TaxID=2986475 RepID=UPI0021F1B540|nr:type VI secretion system tip protein TssI/VgrG [Roseomonas sp. SXEYE001]MCV4209664.1 type VI secretion system tip protein VgrG [Roseomonas sp. SXEYE001]
MPETPLLSMTSAAGADVLVPRRLEAVEGISELFQFQVDAVAENPVDAATLLDKPACVTLRIGDGVSRHFHGIVSEFGQIGRDGAKDITYRILLRPRLLSAALSEDCRMFFNKTAEEIITTVLGDTGTTVTFKLFGNAAPRPATAQFNETGLHFATRLMEEEGWFYFFQHSAGDHELIVTNGNAAFPAIPDTTLQFGVGGSGELGSLLTEWHAPNRITHGEVSLSDYDPAAPDKKLKAKQQTVLNHAGAAQRPVFHWPALTDNTGDVTARAKIRMEAAEAAISLVETSGSLGSLFAGGRFNLQPESGATKPYVVRRIEHLAQAEPRRAGGEEESYANRFTAFPNSVPWRQPLATPRPRMEGLHTAVVLAPSGEEIHTDPQGRVKIRFFWDWRAEATADNSPFVRVVQPWAGNGWGGQFIPRAGTEVAVAFMDADPDRPVVVGGFYNGSDKPIFPEGEKTKTGFRTRSSLKGGTDAFNELSFTDEKDNELVFLQAQKNFTAKVKHDETLTVEHDRVRTVNGKETVTVKGDRTHEVSDGNESLTVKTGNRSVVVEKGNHETTVKLGNHSLEITQGNQDTKLSMGNQSTVLDLGNHATQAKLGDVTVKADVGNITLEALQSITLKVGANTLTLSQQGIEIKGLTVKVDGTVMTEIKGLMLKADGSAMLMLKGGITMVN